MRGKPSMRAALLAEFGTAEALLDAVRVLRENGYLELDTYTPYPVHGLDEVLGLRRSKVPLVILIAGLCGAITGYLLQWYVAAYDYPLNVGGRPAHAIPAFVPITFEMGVLFAAIAALVALLAFAGLPRLWHPVFEVAGFERATIDRFWLSVDAADPRFRRERTASELEALGALTVVYTGPAGRPGEEIE